MLALQLHSLVHALKSVPEAKMRGIIMARKLEELAPDVALSSLRALISRGGRGHFDIGRSLAALVSCLEPPSELSYETRSDLYTAANQQGAAEIIYILLELDSDPSEEKEDVPRPIIPNGRPMSLGERKSVARTKDRLILSHLIHDPNIGVTEILLENPNLKESDILVMASKRPGCPKALRLLAKHSRWSQSRRIRLAIALNPNSPLPLACRLCLDLRDSDLTQISNNAGSPPLLRAHASRLLSLRT